MRILVVGASGATGRLLVQQLLERGHEVRAIVRSPQALVEAMKRHPGLSVIRGSVLEFGAAALARHVEGCGAVASCLGHNLTLRGVLGPPHRLVRDSVRRLCDALRAQRPASPTRFVLMNTAGNGNRDLDERVSFRQKCVIALLRLLLPPHLDNEMAADYLRLEIGHDDPAIEWAAVRPDNLVDQGVVTEYEVHASPTRSALFDPGQTSRINVAHFMAELMTDGPAWQRWKGQMPVIYNRAG